jgi:DNA repair protein SbcD/Mre11
MFKFVHAADLHLGSPFKGISAKNEKIGELLRNSTFKAYDELIRLCLQEDVDFLLIAGDVFDSSLKNLIAQLKFRDGLKELEEKRINVFIACGNHDPYDPPKTWLPKNEWTQNVHFFSVDSSDTVLVKTKSGEEVLIHGISFKKINELDNLALKLKKTDNHSIYQIGVLHCNVGMSKEHDNYAPCSINDLINADLDYWALGHIHKSKIFPGDHNIVYPGNIQGRDINESGEKGCYLVEVNSSDSFHKTFTVFKRLDVVTWQEIEVDITSAESFTDIEKSFEGACLECLNKSLGRAIFSRLVFKGRNHLFGDLDRKGELDDFFTRIMEKGQNYDPFVFLTDIISEIKPVYDLDNFIMNQDFIGDLLRVGKEIKEDENFVKIIDEIFNNNSTNKKLKNLIDNLEKETLEKLLQEAEFMCVDRLKE